MQAPVGAQDIEAEMQRQLEQIEMRFATEPTLQLPVPPWANEMTEDQILELIARCVFGPLYEEP